MVGLTLVGSTGFFSSEPPVSLPEKNLSHVFTRIKTCTNAFSIITDILSTVLTLKTALIPGLLLSKL